MPAKRPKKKTPIASSSSSSMGASSSGSVSRKVTQSIISNFHTLLKQKAIVKRQLQAGPDDDGKLKQRLEELELKLKENGGLEAYQAASRLGQTDDRGGDSSKVLVEWLKGGKGNAQIQAYELHPLRMLELGALQPNNYASCSSWIQNHPIDLQSQHPDVLQQDFFERPMPESVDECFDVISCSLVLNFVSDPKDRGRMLRLIHQHLKPSESSLLFLVLPLACITNSRYLSVSLLQDLMAEVGFELVKERWKNGGKVGYWLWGRREPVIPTVKGRWDRKRVVLDGPKKNNFTILL